MKRYVKARCVHHFWVFESYNSISAAYAQPRRSRNGGLDGQTMAMSQKKKLKLNTRKFDNVSGARCS